MPRETQGDDQNIARRRGLPRAPVRHTGHFALETEGHTIAGLMREFLGKHVSRK
jgi:hypothetical protein